jgi:hypothetical protein
MIEKAIEKIISLADAKVELHDGQLFSTKQLHPVKADLEPAPEVLEIHTLSGLIDYCTAHLDNSKEYVIHIESPASVCVYGEFEPKFGRRKQYLTCNAYKNRFEFGKFYDQEMFIIWLQTGFVDSNFRSQVLAICGNVDDSMVRNNSDDGFTQHVTAKAGIKRVENVQLPNPIALKPYRSFPEVEQVESLFVLRAKKIGEEITFALFEADGGAWQSSAIQVIDAYINEKLDKGISIWIIS